MGRRYNTRRRYVMKPVSREKQDLVEGIIRRNGSTGCSVPFLRRATEGDMAKCTLMDALDFLVRLDLIHRGQEDRYLWGPAPEDIAELLMPMAGTEVDRYEYTR
jgi:hypothetical protein